MIEDPYAKNQANSQMLLGEISISGVSMKWKWMVRCLINVEIPRRVVRNCIRKQC